MPPSSLSSGSGRSMEQVEALMAAVIRQTGASAGLLYLRPPGDRLLWLALLSGVSRQIAAPWVRAELDASTPVADSMLQRRLVWLDSQEDVARRYPQLGLVVPYDFALAAAPFVGGIAVWGGLALLWPVGNAAMPSSHQREVLSEYCRQTVLLLDQAAAQGHPLLPPAEPRYLPAASKNADPGQATAALDFTERLPQGCCALDLEGRLTFINRAGVELVGADAASLAGRRPWEALPWLSSPASEEGYRAAVISRRPASFTAMRLPGRPLLFELYPDDSGISVHITAVPQRTATTQAAVPDESVGAMGLYHLTHLAAALSKATTVHDVSDVVAHQIVPAFGPQGLVLLTTVEGRLHIIGHCGYSSEFIDRFDGMSLTSHAPTAHVQTTGDPVFFPTFADFQRTYPEAPRYGARNAWAFLPLTASSRTIGSLVLSYDQPRPFRPAERALLTSLAALIAQALDRARLYDAQHTIAHTLQTGLLPLALPHIPGLDAAARYQSASHGVDIGGDFYDLIHAPTAITAAIGDVQGHNTVAAALMGQVRTAVHAHAAAGTSPGVILARINRLLADLDTNLFTSCLVVQLDLASHRARLATAGHPSPLLRHPDGRTEVLSLTPQLLLGIDPDADYHTTDIPLPPGAVLVLYTDGLVEVPGTDIEDTTNVLARYLARTQVQNLDQLAQSLVHHAQHSARDHDDIALLLIRPHP